MATAKIFNERTGETFEYYIDDRLKKNLDEKIIPSLHKKDKDCVMVIDGREGCLSEDTLIKTTDGDIKIKDLCGKSFFVESLNLETNKIEIDKATCVSSGAKELFEIETIDGRKIEATANHTFFVLRNSKVYEVKLSDLIEGDELICK